MNKLIALKSSGGLVRSTIHIMFLTHCGTGFALWSVNDTTKGHMCHRLCCSVAVVLHYIEK